VFLYQITFLQQNTTASLLELYFNDSMQTVYARGGGGCGSRQRQVADGADVVFTDTRADPLTARITDAHDSYKLIHRRTKLSFAVHVGSGK